MQTRSFVLGVVLATALSSATALASADAATSHQAHQSAKAGKYKVTAKVNQTEPLLDSKVKIKGAVSPAAPGATVTLQVRYEDRKKWKTIDTARLNNASKYKLKDKVGSVRERKYRVVKAAGPNRSAGRSPSLKVTVFGWRNLTSLVAATSAGVAEVENATINGVKYPSSLQSVGLPSGSSIDYNINRDCKAFRGTAGLEDTSPNGGTGVVSLLADGFTKYTGGFGLAQSAPVYFEVPNVFRLTVSTSTTGGGIAAVGTPQVLCSF
jgi:hypothetical protein